VATTRRFDETVVAGTLNFCDTKQCRCRTFCTHSRNELSLLRRYDQCVVRCGEQIFVDFVNCRAEMWRKLEGTAEMILRGPLRSAEIGDTLVKGIGLPASTLLSDVGATLREAVHIWTKNVGDKDLGTTNVAAIPTRGASASFE
jgi:hypothetical protein